VDHILQLGWARKIPSAEQVEDKCFGFEEDLLLTDVAELRPGTHQVPTLVFVRAAGVENESGYTEVVGAREG